MPRALAEELQGVKELRLHMVGILGGTLHKSRLNIQQHLGQNAFVYSRDG